MIWDDIESYCLENQSTIFHNLNSTRSDNGLKLIQLLQNLIEKLYEPKANKKLIRVLTVIAYCICVSLIAILLSLYYLFIWNPYNKVNQKQHQQQHMHRV